MILADRKKTRNIIILILSLLILVSCTKKKEDVRISDSRIAMGTTVSIAVYDEKDKEYLTPAFDLVYDIEKLISNKLSSTYVSLINQNAGIAPVEVPEELFSLIEYAMNMNEKTDGLFNPAIGALSSLWGIATDNAKVPDEESLEKALLLINPGDVVLDKENSTVYLKKAGMMLDLGGIGKGYASNKVRDFLVSKGVERAIINLGGNVHTIGTKSNGQKWKVGIMNPESHGSYIALVDTADQCVITSGGYERFFEEDGVIYHHILDSSTGYPFVSDLLSATIITDDGILGDALSTSAFAGGKEYAEKLAKKFGVKIIVYTTEKELITFDEL